jgi:putative transposase
LTEDGNLCLICLQQQVVYPVKRQSAGEERIALLNSFSGGFFMPRKPRILTQAGVYHVVIRGNNRQSLFKESQDFEYFLSMVQLLKAEHQFDLYHYCLMTNHAHLLLRFYDCESLQKVMQRVNLRYAKYFRRLYGYQGHLFQDRFKSFAIEKDEYLLDCGRYIERNPLKAKMVEDLKVYPWSSYGYYAFGERRALITRNPLFDDLGGNEQERQFIYRARVLTDRPYEQFINQGIIA